MFLEHSVVSCFLYFYIMPQIVGCGYFLYMNINYLLNVFSRDFLGIFQLRFFVRTHKLVITISTSLKHIPKRSCEFFYYKL